MVKRLAVVIVLAALMAAPSFGQLAGYWNFNEGSGTNAADSSGKSNPGVLQANGSGSLPQWITGHDGTGYALRFNYDTTSSANANRVFVDINTADAVASLGGAFTISMWVRSDQIDDWVLRVPTGDWRWLIYTNAYDFELAMDPNTASSSTIDGWDYFSSDLTSAWYQIPFPDNWEDWGQNYTGLWYHLAITFDGNYLKKYVNGNVVFVLGAPESSLATATSGLYFAAMSTFSGYFAGDLDDIAVWAGTYLPSTEVAKLAADTATPLTVADHAAEPPLPPMNYTESESDMAWQSGGAVTLWSPGFNWDAYTYSNTSKTVWMASAWWFKDYAIIPGGRSAVDYWNKSFPIRLSDYVWPDTNVANFGVEWIDTSWSGVPPIGDANQFKLAAYAKTGYAICQENHWYQPYDPSPSRALGWEDKPYWKTYARVSGYHAQGCSFRVKVYMFYGDNEWAPLDDPCVLIPLGEVSFPLSGVDHQWQEFKFLLPKGPTIGGSGGGNWWTTWHWFELSIVGGDANTMLYVDEFAPISDRYANYFDADFNLDTKVNYDDLDILADEWLGHGEILDPRSGGMLTNADFTADKGLLNMSDDYSWVTVTPTGWTVTGTGDRGIQNMSKRGHMNFDTKVVDTPMGGDVAAYIINDAVLKQTTAATMVAGHTYYAMAYVMTSSWQGWKDTATMTLQANDVNLASFSRVLSIERWRPVYGTYTATSSDAGKPITLSFSYANTHTVEDPNPGYLFIGYAYVGDTMPPEWPEKRQNLLVNGGFEDLTEVNAISPALYHSLTAADNYGGWFTSSIHPTTPGWVYEVPAGYDFGNKGGLWGHGFYGSPLPTSGMHDIGIYTDNSLILGQVVGALANGTTYYLDSACAVSDANYLNDVNWPNPAPRLRVELWRIPVGVTDGTVIYNAIAGGNPSYVKVAEANVAATGDMLGANATRGTVASKWQIIGTSYTATADDTAMYVRIRGSGGTSPKPSFAFSDVYLSTAKRLVPGGAVTFDLSSGLQSEVLGPYNYYHATVMNLYAADTDGNGIVNLFDLVRIAQKWLQSSFTDATGATDW